MNDIFRSIESSSVSTLPLYASQAVKYPPSVRTLIQDKVEERKGQLALTGVYALELSEALNAASILTRINEAKLRGAITEADHQGLLKAWELRRAAL